MKVKSSYGKEVYLEDWNTPIMHNEQLWLVAELRIMNGIHLFFKLNSSSRDEYYSFTISFRCPLRITDETYAHNCIGKYLNRKVIRPKDEQRSSTLKLWNTSFIKEIEENNALSGYAAERDKNIFQYLIITEDEWVEFITLSPIEWTFHKCIKIDELLNTYIKESAKQ
ncbi:MAG: hypothetical protein HOP07_00635 [Bacteriovoracaceae bacterium]|nr:hypothetical protein [Bacteriovoracaceae bacterium]